MEGIYKMCVLQTGVNLLLLLLPMITAPP